MSLTMIKRGTEKNVSRTWSGVGVLVTLGFRCLEHVEVEYHVEVK